MSRFFLAMFMLLTMFAFSINETSAKSFNVSISNLEKVGSPITAFSSPKLVTGNIWRGTLAGLLLGSFLTSLLMGHGVSGLVFSWLIVGITLYLISNLIRRRRRDNF